MKLMKCLVVAVFVLVAANVAQAQICNNGTITIPDSGPATPYPSTINVAGQPPSITDVNLTLNSLTHTFPDDLDILLVGPGGQMYSFHSDAGGSGDVVDVTYTLDDGAGSPLSDAGPLVAGTFRPANYTAGDTFPAPAPPGPYNEAAPAGAATFASVYGATNPNGTWSLYVNDDAAGDLGAYTGGWCLTITATPVELQSFEVE